MLVVAVVVGHEMCIGEMELLRQHEANPRFCCGEFAARCIVSALSPERRVLAARRRAASVAVQ